MTTIPAWPNPPVHDPTDDELATLHAWWRAANYLSVGQIDLMANPLLREPSRGLKAMYITGPGHGGPGLVAASYLEGTYSDVSPDVNQDKQGLRRAHAHQHGADDPRVAGRQWDEDADGSAAKGAVAHTEADNR